MVFSDTTTDPLGLWQFTSDPYPYATTPNESTEIQDFGGDETPAQAIPWGEGECATDIVDQHPEWCTV